MHMGTALGDIHTPCPETGEESLGCFSLQTCAEACSFAAKGCQVYVWCLFLFMGPLGPALIAHLTVSGALLTTLHHADVLLASRCTYL